MVRIRAGGRTSRSRGFSLLEAMAASGMMAALLVPTLATMRHAMLQSEETALRRFLAQCAVQTLEQACGQQMAAWQAGDSADKAGALQGVVVMCATKTSDALADGGVPGRLMVVEVLAWGDRQRNSAVDAGELKVRLVTKVAKLSSYAN